MFSFNELPIGAWNCVVRKLLELKATAAVFSTQTHCKHSCLISDPFKSKYIYLSHETNAIHGTIHIQYLILYVFICLVLHIFTSF